MTRSCLLAIALLISNLIFSKNILHPDEILLSISVVSQQNPNCSNPLGSITVIATGGVPTYTYNWNTGASGPTISNIPEGDYTVVVTDDTGNSAELEISLLGNFEAPLADAGAPKVVNCSNSLTTLSGSGSSGPGFTYQWVASNGGHILSGATTLSPVVNEAGTFQLTVTNQNNGCTASDLTTVTATNISPAANVSGGVINCYANSVTLGANFTTLNTRFSWQGPNGFMSQLKNPVVTMAGNYVFSLTDTLTGCIRKDTAVVTSNLVVPNADATGGGTITCAQTTVQLFGSSTTPGAIFSWTGPNGYSSSLQNPIVNAAGGYTLTVQNPANGCTATDPITVNSNLVAPIPTASASGTLTCASPTIQLFGGSNTPGVSYAWTGPGNYQSSLQNPQVNTPGLYILVVKNPSNGCTGSATATVQQNITPPNVSATGGVKTCANPTVILMGSSTTPNVSYSWTGPNGFLSTQQNPSVSFVGSYTLRVTNPVNGCSATAVTTVSQNITPPSVSATSTTITCYNPLAQITTNTSPQGLTYNWSGPENFSSSLKNPQVGVSGYYYVTVTNPANGCTNLGSVFTNANITAPFAYAGDDKSLNCYFKTVLINASFSSNGPNFSYQWTTWDGNIIAGANSLYPSVDTAGNYTLTVTNTQNGCIDKDSMIVIESPPVTAVITQTSPVSCSGGSNGTARVVADGGSYNYNYSWSNGKTTANINSLSAGVYTVTVIDTEGCSTTASTTIQQLVLNANVNVTHQTIPGVNNGTASVNGIGGTAPYTVLWSTGAVTLNIGALAPGPYSVTVTDAKGCTVVKTTNVNVANCIISGTGSGVNVTCFGANNGSATINLMSSLNPVTYAWSNGGTSKTINGLAPGSYTVTATDASSCQVVQTVQITGPQALLATVITKADVRCPSTADGSITVGVTGGVQPYTYQWSNNAASASIANLGPGNYTLTATDANGCTSTVSAQINAPSPIVITILNKTDVDCPGSNSGAISISAQGGLPPYQYFWSNGSTLSNISGLTPGNYTITVTDNNDCPKSLSAQIVVADQTPPVLNLKNATVDLDPSGSVSVSANLFDNGSQDACGIATWTVSPNTFNCSQIGQNTITITATDLGGNTSTGTAVLTILDNIVPTLACPENIVRGSCNAVVSFNIPQVFDNCQVNPTQLVQLSGLPSGANFPLGNTAQSFQYTDLGGNIGQCSFNVLIGDEASFANNSVPATCSGACDGTATLTQLSGGDVNILWSNGQTSPNLTGLCPGNYTATITDSYGCTQTQSVVITVVDTEAPSVACPANVSSSYCAGPVTYNQPVVTDNCQLIPNSLQLIAGMPSGSIFPQGSTVQTFRYTDGGGNIGQCSFTVNISSPSVQTTATQAVSCANLCDGTATLNIVSGEAPFSIQWSNGQTGLTALNLCAGNYTYMISDAAGCLQSGSVAVTQPQPLMLSVDQVMNDVGNAGLGSIQISVSGGIPPYTYQWTRNGQFFSNTKDLSNLFQGQYIGTATDGNGCTVSSSMVTITSLVSTKTPEWTQALSISPNPANEFAVLDFSAPLGQKAAVELCDLNGRVLRTEHLNASADHLRLDVSNCAAGIWFVQLRLEDGQRTTRKLVVIK
jgi:hypothetical protein